MMHGTMNEKKKNWDIWKELQGAAICNVEMA